MFSFVAVIIPILISIISLWLSDPTKITISSVQNDISIVLFSLLCSLLSIYREMWLQQKGKSIKWFVIIIVAIAFSWCYYIYFTLYKTKLTSFILCIVIGLLIVVLSIIGILVGNKKDSNENQLTEEMHKNCKIFRNKAVEEEINDKLASLKKNTNYAILL